MDEAPDSIEAIERSIQQWEQQRESIIKFFHTTVAEGQGLVQDLQYVNHYCV